MATIKRGAKGARRTAKANARANTARKAKKTTGGFIDWLMGLLPFTEEQLQRIFLWLIIILALAAAWFIANISGATAMVQAQISQSAANAGFEVRHVRVSGVERMNEDRVYERVVSQRNEPMPDVDVVAIREELLELPWVKDARVSRQLPGTLAIDIVEREPHAVLQKPDHLVLVDVDGNELEPIRRTAIGERLVISGPGAVRQVRQLDDLLEAAPAIRPQVRAAEWVGNRRWNLTFKTNQVLALPQGDDEAATALVSFARLDGQNRLIGGEVTTFDMRAPPRIYMRIPGRADQVLGGSPQDGETTN
ncbi:FtsQ-type POTRA domain-containing protein [Altererythrobacter sp.]|uniref:cell division protein FtsQ/DivIB n=1 Tax=Altererythrobacter sp. TaxID=1872480 RepID=UPI001B02A8C8|nr:FtsQ-type POTRA domain-containing protein [Altererythrobacter sp.]MBO6608846.1 FtsQ-type POTRA domain-containing protein [Altererythrobacter sp.]MBO6640886.1 FtsQ-type POTRA domain-containing protein [Altererythrobacter sp.]MBO6708416.1 FtsQ-type POTRA domain-containing protein [Altererythrobacter sp.]MBO6945447.1 FtsQ-type POTRA domain-containing protein [Altererythrobacter sp.]